ncbi:SH3 domain-containing protein [Amycolatopsis pigmentata]|uniref:SH3 domain-containing protein n=1 Tax=Amycolatopsis pigmentata TaxID=450801 RepID=A0ABW5G803_9PSEU
MISARGANRQAQPQDTPAEAGRNVITATVSPQVSTLNVRAVADGTTTVDLGPSAVIGTLEPGDTVRVMCEFTSDETSDGGSDWYRIAGPNVPDTASGAGAVASAGYLAVAPDAAVPSCATRDAGYGTPLTGRTTASSRVSREPPRPSPRA